MPTTLKKTTTTEATTKATTKKIATTTTTTPTTAETTTKATTTTPTTTARRMTTELPPDVQAALTSNTSGHLNIPKEEATQKLETPTSPKEDSDISGVDAAKVRTATVSPELTEPNVEEELGSTKVVSTGRLQDSVTLPTGCKISCSLGYPVLFY